MLARIEDCAVAVAIPLDKARWLSDITPGSKREYARFYLQNAGATFEAGEDVWTKLYEPHEVRSIRNALGEIERLGAAVVLDCGVEHISTLTRQRKIVVIIAHWRSGMLYADHLIDQEEFLDLLRNSSAPLLTRLRAGLPANLRSQLMEPKTTLTAKQIEALLACLNALMQTRLIGSNDADSPAAFELAQNRAALNAECANAIDTTEGLELEGGTYGSAEVSRAVWEGFTGVLDLTACFSVVLGEAVKRKVPGCLIIANRQAVSPSVRLSFIRETLRVLARTPGDYIEVSRAIREQLLN